MEENVNAPIQGQKADEQMTNLVQILDKMTTGVAHFTYTKSDGTMREAFGTLRHIPKYDPKKVQDLIDNSVILKVLCDQAANEGMDMLQPTTMSQDLEKALKPFMPKDKKPATPSEYVNYYDIEAEGWRKVHPDKIVKIF